MKSIAWVAVFAAGLAAGYAARSYSPPRGQERDYSAQQAKPVPNTNPPLIPPTTMPEANSELVELRQQILDLKAANEREVHQRIDIIAKAAFSEREAYDNGYKRGRLDGEDSEVGFAHSEYERGKRDGELSARFDPRNH